MRTRPKVRAEDAYKTLYSVLRTNIVLDRLVAAPHGTAPYYTFHTYSVGSILTVHVHVRQCLAHLHACCRVLLLQAAQESGGRDTKVWNQEARGQAAITH